MTSKLAIGTSGWHYKDWKGPVYPKELPARDYLRYYAKTFQTVELNNSFYRLPDLHAARLWYNAVPSRFMFAVKANRFITHIKRLRDCQEPVQRFLAWASYLKGKLGPILFQLPPHWQADAARLDDFVNLLPKTYDYAFEFRDPSWFAEEIYSILKRRRIALCVFDRQGESSPNVVTSDMVYLRFHGPQPKYHGAYDRAALARWARVIESWRRLGKRIYIYFNNDYDGNAVKNAQMLAQMLS